MSPTLAAGTSARRPPRRRAPRTSPMTTDLPRPALLALLLGLALAGRGSAQPAGSVGGGTPPNPRSVGGGTPPNPRPAHLPRYRVDVDLDVERGVAQVRQEATWTNPAKAPTDR